MVIMRWNGAKRGDQPVAFVGKGVCFDTGGISIKPAGSMEDMKGDMGGAACVVGLMHALAARKAKVNAVGAIGLVENMPDGTLNVPAMSSHRCPVRPSDHQHRRRRRWCWPTCSGMWRRRSSRNSCRSRNPDRAIMVAPAPNMPGCSPTTTNWPSA
jgi:hypothetical protein